MSTTDTIDQEATYYLSGPMSGLPDYNYPYFERVARRLKYFGLEVVSPTWIDPVKRTDDMTEEVYWQKCIDGCMKLMETANAIVLLQGWPRSRGARLELTYALDHRWPVYFYVDRIDRLLNMTEAPNNG